MHEFSELTGTIRALRSTAQSGKRGAVGRWRKLYSEVILVIPGCHRFQP